MRSNIFESKNSAMVDTDFELELRGIYNDARTSVPDKIRNKIEDRPWFESFFYPEDAQETLTQSVASTSEDWRYVLSDGTNDFYENKPPCE